MSWSCSLLWHCGYIHFIARRLTLDCYRPTLTKFTMNLSRRQCTFSHIFGFKFVEKASGINTLSRSPYNSNMWDNLLHISYILWMYSLLWRGFSSTLGRKYELWKYISLTTVDSRLLSLTLSKFTMILPRTQYTLSHIFGFKFVGKASVINTLFRSPYGSNINIIKNVYKLLKIQFQRKAN